MRERTSNTKKLCACLMGIALVVCLLPLHAAADPEVLTDSELDQVSAKGFSFPSLNFGLTPSVAPTVQPTVVTENENETAVNNLILAVTTGVNVNTAVNTCVLAVCADGGAQIQANPEVESNVVVTNSIVPSISNVVQVPTSTPTQVGTGAQPPIPAANLVPSAPVVRHGMTRTRPPLPTASYVR